MDKSWKGATYFNVPHPEHYDELSWRGRCAWMALCSFASWNEARTLGRCWPSQSALGGVLNLSRMTMLRGLRELEELGIMKRERQHGESCVYILQVQGMRLTDTGVVPHRNRGYTSQIQGVRLPETGGVSDRYTNITNNITSNNNYLTKEQTQALFEGFWEQFRRYNAADRADARAAFEELFPPGLDLETARSRRDALTELLNDQGQAWEENLERGQTRFNPKMGNWLRRQFPRPEEADAA